MNVFNFSNISKSEITIQRTWNDFRSALAEGRFSYYELDKAKSSATYLKVFDDLFSHCHQFFDTPIDTILSSATSLIRAGRLKPEESKPTYSRFIPNKEYIKDHNRFSPPGVEWLYLAVGDINNAEACALKECRASNGELFGICQFQLNKKYSGKTLVDLTIAKEVSYKELNNQLEKSAQKICKSEVKKAVNSLTRKGYFEEPDTNEITEQFTKWAAFTYARLLSEQIFLPVETDNKELMYSPFQCMAYYFLSIGYEGIVYSSTVFPEGKNVVLFHKDAACPIGEIKIRNT